MNILNRRPLTISEAKSFVKESEEKKPIHDYFKAFAGLSLDKAKKLEGEIRALNNPKLKEEDIIKIVDFLPQDSEDVNKICLEVALSEEEINKILELVKKY